MRRSGFYIAEQHPPARGSRVTPDENAIANLVPFRCSRLTRVFRESYGVTTLGSEIERERENVLATSAVYVDVRESCRRPVLTQYNALIGLQGQVPVRPYDRTQRRRDSIHWQRLPYPWLECRG